MTNLTPIDNAETFIFTPSGLEAADIAAVLEEDGLRSIASALKMPTAQALLAGAGLTPKLILFGFPLDNAEAEELMHVVRKTGASVLVINGDTPHAVAEGLPVLKRPFSSAALRMCLLSTGVDQMA